MPKVSVIIPVYNVEPFIERCARSLMEQTLDDLELLFVDDCSPDSSVSIIRQVLEDYPNRKLQTRIIPMSANAGQAGVRRHGLIHATGDFVIHCDGDDWVDTDLYEKMYNRAIAEDADIVLCDEIQEWPEGPEKIFISDLCQDPKAIIKNWYRNTLGMFCHNKLVKRSIYTDNDILPWPGLNMWEDNGLMTRVFYHGTKLTQIHDSFYHYNRSNIHSMTSGYGQAQVEQMIGVAEHLTDFFLLQHDSEDFKKTIMAFQFLAKLNLITDSFKNISRYNSIFPGSEAIASELDPRAFSTKGKVRFYMVKYHLSYLFVSLFKLKTLILNSNG